MLQTTDDSQPGGLGEVLQGEVLLGEVLIELHAIGGAVRCTAVDPLTGIEVVVAGPRDGGELLERTAVAKLRRAVARQRSASAEAEHRPAIRRGWVV